MNQKNLINLYNKNLNSMFDDSESSEEIKDSANNSHDELNKALSEKNQPELFHCILDMMNDYPDKYPHESNKYLKQSELNKINFITYKKDKTFSWLRISYFEKFNPPDGDFSIIFKYLRNVKILGQYCFYACEYLKKITIPITVNLIEYAAISNNDALKELYLPDSIEILPKYGMIGCTNLTEINLPKNLKVIGSFCFSQCFSLKQIILPDKVTSIQNSCFSLCRKLKSVTINNNIKNIDHGSFYNCTYIQSITIPKTFSQILPNIFDKYCLKNKKTKITFI